MVRFSHHKQKAGSDFLYINRGWTYNGWVMVLMVMPALFLQCSGCNFRFRILMSTLIMRCNLFFCFIA